jgi:hypothetical protein
MSAVLITTEEARRWLRLGPPSGDAEEAADLEDKMAQASAIFLRYHSDGVVPEAWMGTSSPAEADPALVDDDAKQAIAIILHDLWDRRGENPVERAYSLMRMIRGPALA